MLDAPLNHPRGRGNPRTTLPTIRIKGDASAMIDLGKVEIHCGLFEVPYAEVMEVLPASLHPSTPGYGSLTFYRIPQSPVGAFELAVMGVACRNTIKPRIMTLSAFASSEAAASFCRDRFGYPCEVADVRTRRPYHAAISEIHLGGRCVAQIHTVDAEYLLGSSRAVRYPQALNLAEIQGKLGLLQVDMVYNYDQSQRGRLVIEVFDSKVLAAGRINPTDLIAATYVLAEIQVKPAKILLDLDEVGAFSKLQPGGLEATLA